MRIFIGLSGLLLLPFGLFSQDKGNALLWSISGNGLTTTSYVYGTVHSKDDRAFTYAGSVEERIAGVRTVAGELDLDATRTNAMAMMGRMLMPSDQRLEDLYTKKQWKVVEPALKAELGFMAPMVMRMKPFFIMSTLTEAAMGGSRPKVLDDHLMSHAKGRGHRTIGLESVDEQLRAMDAMPLKEQAAMLLDHIRNDGYRGMLEQMMVAYAAQDLGVLMEITEKGGGGMPKAMEKALLTDRNRVMAHRMDSVMRVDTTALFLIGAAHLPGQGGVVQLLRDKGYAVEAVAIEANAGITLAQGLPEGGMQYVNDTLGFKVYLPAAPMSMPKPSDPGGWMLQSEGKEQGLNVVVLCHAASEEHVNFDALLTDGRGMGPEMTSTAVVVQGLEAKRITFSTQGTFASNLVIVRDGRQFMVVAMSADQAITLAVLDSFRFTDLPE